MLILRQDVLKSQASFKFAMQLKTAPVSGIAAVCHHNQLISRFGCQIGEVYDLANLKHQFPFIKHSLGMLVLVIPAPPGAETR